MAMTDTDPLGDNPVIDEMKRKVAVVVAVINSSSVDNCMIRQSLDSIKLYMDNMREDNWRGCCQHCIILLDEILDAMKQEKDK